MSDPESSSNIVRIAVDAMGGDFGPEIIIPALDMTLKAGSNISFLIFGDEKKITPYLKKHKSLKEHTEIHHTDKMVQNAEKPAAALRASKGSSMRMAIEAVKSGEADAVVSAGNTGALMAVAKIVLKMVPGIHRPAIASVMPGIHGDTIMLDLGANMLVDAENLVQFAILGSAFARANGKNNQKDKPTVGLLNMGTEETKGPDHVRRAAEILSRVDFPGTYKGFVEGNDITNGTVDVIVSDGYAGNIALKTAEGVGTLASHSLKKALTSDPLAMLGGLFAYFAFKKMRRQMDPRLYNGGIFLGLNGICVKSHGGADSIGFSSAVTLAARLARQGYTEHVTRDIAHLTDQETFFSQEA